MSRLKDRQRQIPNGFKFRLAEAKFNAPPFKSFSAVVELVERVVQANPGLAAKNQWPTSRVAIENWVDSYNARLCETHGWHEFIMSAEPGGPASPKWPPLPSPPSALGRLVAGAATLDDWLGEGGVPVPAEQAEVRASICADCPRNDQGDWTRFFTQPAAEVIRRKLEHRAQLKLSTSWDHQLKVCTACYCPMKLKVHTPLSYITQHMDAETRADLDPRCWILKGL